MRQAPNAKYATAATAQVSTASFTNVLWNMALIVTSGWWTNNMIRG
jgi:hypothetical protein